MSISQSEKQYQSLLEDEDFCLESITIRGIEISVESMDESGIVLDQDQVIQEFLNLGYERYRIEEITREDEILITPQGILEITQGNEIIIDERKFFKDLGDFERELDERWAETKRDEEDYKHQMSLEYWGF